VPMNLEATYADKPWLKTESNVVLESIRFRASDKLSAPQCSRSFDLLVLQPHHFLANILTQVR
jgi:hypothetical protein